ncbi:hypothetical protein B0H10DRAFT_1954535 [Mycena sp. CBHHK59/15]|nr:hypothetical protein B0H10DRAFT_1954535 [Mycena sp. CBHHK59/15]
MHPVPAAPQAVPTSSLLKCLDNLDILCEIVRYGHGEAANAQPGDSALPQLALVCRAFCEPALDALWRSMGSLLPLLKLLPSFQEVNGVYVLLGPLQAEDWVRFDFYAKKVRAMKYTGITDIVIDPFVYVRIARYHPAPMLPELRQLNYSSPSQSGPEIMLFTAPSLHRLEIASENDEFGPTFTMLLSDAVASMPELEHLALDLLFPPIILDFSLQFNHLRVLKILNIDKSVDLGNLEQFLEALSSFENIRSLTLSDIPHESFDLRQVRTPEEDERVSTPVRRTFAFPGLRVLELSGDIQWISHFITALETTVLHSVSFSADFLVRDWREWLQFPLNHIVPRWSSSLENISLHQLHSRARGSPTMDEDNFGQRFADLSTIRNLRQFSLSGSPPIWVREEDVAALATGCPNIVILQIDVHRNTALASFNSLIYLAEHCPLLRELRMGFDVEDVLMANMPTLLEHGLEVLFVYRTDGFRGANRHTIQAVARFLDCIFPKLKTVSGREDEWDEVDELIHILQGARAHERRRLAYS